MLLQFSQHYRNSAAKTWYMWGCLLHSADAKEAFAWFCFISIMCACGYVSVAVCCLLTWRLLSSYFSSLLFRTSVVQIEQPESITGRKGRMLVCFFNLNSLFWFSRCSWHSTLTCPRNSLVQSTYIMPFGELGQCFSSCILWSTTTGQWILRTGVVLTPKD